MTNSISSVFVVILNWNNASDTIECIQSLKEITYLNLNIVIIDNGSSDKSIEELSIFLKNEIGKTSVDRPNVSSKDISVPEELIPVEFSITENRKVCLISSPINLGFAKGSNVGINFAMSNEADYLLLLNNDTTVEPGFLNHLVSFLQEHRDYSAVSPQIRNYYKRDIACNCGGELKWYGARKYYYYNTPVNSLPKEGIKEISFINNCAVLYRASLFKELGILSEKFFFGEEDFEFSMRLKKNGKKAACCFSSIIYHKVSHTVDETFSKNSLGKIYIYYLNRFVNMRSYMNKMLWHIWCYLYLFYIFYLLKRNYRFTTRQLISFSSRLIKNSGRLNAVDKSVFENAIKMKFD